MSFILKNGECDTEERRHMEIYRSNSKNGKCDRVNNQRTEM